MKKTVIVIALLVVAAIAGGAVIRHRIETATDATKTSIASLTARLEESERERDQLRQRVAATEVPAEVTPPLETTAAAPTPAETATTTPPDTSASQLPTLTNSMRDVVVSVERCELSNRTLRCHFHVINQSAAEKKFILGVGGN